MAKKVNLVYPCGAKKGYYNLNHGGVLDGEMRLFFENGEPWIYRYYENGVLSRYKVWDKFGNVSLDKYKK